MPGSSGSGRLARSGAGRAASGTESRQVEVGISRGASQPAVASGGAAQPALQELVDEIIQLGHMPKQTKNVSVEEKDLAVRLIRARKAGLLTREQEAALDNFAQASGASQSASSRGVVETPTVMEQWKTTTCWQCGETPCPWLPMPCPH